MLRPSSDFLRHIHSDCMGAFVSGYQYMGPGTHLKTRLKRGDPGINRLDKIAKQQGQEFTRKMESRSENGEGDQ